MNKSETSIIEQENIVNDLKVKSTLKLKSESSNDSKKDWKRFFRKEFYSSKVFTCLTKFVKNENKEQGVFFLKRKILLWSYLLIVLIANIVFFSTFHLAVAGFDTFTTQGTTIMVVVICVMVIIWFFVTLFSLFKIADKYSYRLQAFAKQLLIKIGIVNFSNVIFYLNDVRVPILTLRHKSIQFLEQTFRQFKTNDKQIFCLRYLISFEQKIKQETFVELVNSNVNAKNEDRVIPYSKKDVFKVLPVFKTNKTKQKEQASPKQIITPKEENIPIISIDVPVEAKQISNQPPNRKKNRGNKQKTINQPNTPTTPQPKPKQTKKPEKEHK